jgi:hypothetical protein
VNDSAGAKPPLDYRRPDLDEPETGDVPYLKLAVLWLLGWCLLAGWFMAAIAGFRWLRGW